MTVYPPVGYSSEVRPLACEAPRETWQEWASTAFVQAVASAAGLLSYVPQVDANQIDVMVQTFRPLEGDVRTIGLQLKSTSVPEFVHNNAYVAYDLAGDRYNRMLEPGTVPRFFVVIAVDPPPASLVLCENASTTLRAVGWWGRVVGEPTQQSYKRIYLPVEQRFDAVGLLEMLRMA